MTLPDVLNENKKNDYPHVFPCLPSNNCYLLIFTSISLGERSSTYKN